MENLLRYDPLNTKSNEIRLLRLYPASSLSAPLICDLIHEELKPGLPYEALSYTWGSSIRARSMTINSHEFPVTISLWSSLRHVRSPEFCRVLWVDAVCINQEDIAERNVQVVRMREIYVHATRVLIWLGPSGYDSDLALNTLKVILEFEKKFMAKADQSLRDGDLRAQLIQRLRADSGVVLDSADSADNATPWIALGRFFKRVWWFRAWIIQEATCNNETIFHCGTSTISWKDLGNACSVLMDTGSHSIGTYVLASEGFYRFSRMLVFCEQ